MESEGATLFGKNAPDALVSRSVRLSTIVYKAIVKNPAFRPLRERLQSRVAQVMSKHGFVKRFVGQSLRKPIDGGRWSLHLSFIPHESDFDVTADVAIRLDAVEQLLHRSSRLLSEREKARTATIGAELGNLADGRFRNWTVVTERDVELIAPEIVAEFAKFGLPYLERLSDPEVMLQTLSANDPRAWRSSPIHLHRCKTVLALAYTLRGVSGLKSVMPTMERFLQERSDPGAAELAAFGSELIAP